MTTLAIDIGGTKIAAAVCDENDSIIQRWRVPTPMDADAINQHIAEVYREAVAAGHTRRSPSPPTSRPGSTTTCPSTSAR